MEKVFKNREFFVQNTFDSSKHLWDDCMKEASSIEADSKKEQGAFM